MEQNLLIEWILQHKNCELNTSSEVTYDKFAYDEEYSEMYRNHEIGIFKKLCPKIPEDWSKQVIINLFREEIATHSDTLPVILDIGSGTGFPAIRISDLAKKITCIDNSVELQKIMFDNLNEFNINNIHVNKGVGESLPFNDNSFDIVVMSHFIEFSRKPQICMNELSRVLKNDGYVIGLTSNWKKALNGIFRYLGKETILYPLFKAEHKIIQGEDLLKYRVCTLEPSYEISTYFHCEKKYIDGLVEIINAGYLKLAISVLEKIENIKIEISICEQYDEKSIISLYENANFKIEKIHGVRIPILRFIESMLEDRDFDFSFFEKNFNSISKHMTKIVRSTSPLEGFDMFVVAQNKKG